MPPVVCHTAAFQLLCQLLHGGDVPFSPTATRGPRPLGLTRGRRWGRPHARAAPPPPLLLCRRGGGAAGRGAPFGGSRRGGARLLLLLLRITRRQRKRGDGLTGCGRSSVPFAARSAAGSRGGSGGGGCLLLLAPRDCVVGGEARQREHRLLRPRQPDAQDVDLWEEKKGGAVDDKRTPPRSSPLTFSKSVDARVSPIARTRAATKAVKGSRSGSAALKPAGPTAGSPPPARAASSAAPLRCQWASAMAISGVAWPRIADTGSDWMRAKKAVSSAASAAGSDAGTAGPPLPPSAGVAALLSSKLRPRETDGRGGGATAARGAGGASGGAATAAGASTVPVEGCCCC